MLSRRKNNMFMSCRYNPRDLQSVFEEIQLNVRRGLKSLRCNSDNKESDNSDEIAGQLNDLAIEDLTSVDFSHDIRLDYRTHEFRIRDIIYMKKLWKAICCNSHLFKDKIVLDVSCDLGTLSMFSAIAGAKHIYAIDTSDIVQLTRRIIADNNLSNKITVIKGKVADITLPVDEVDIIVSHFFGQSLFCGNRLDELIDARKKWLKPTGLIFPDRSTLYIGAINNSLSIDRSNFWQHVYQFRMHQLVEVVNSEPYLNYVDTNQIVTDACPIKHINLYTVEKDDYKQFDAPFRLKCGMNAYIGAFFIYFDIEFTEGIHPIKFTTEPGMPNTCWSPMIFFLSINDLLVDDYEKMYGVFRMNALTNDYKKIDWSVQIIHQGQHGNFNENWHFKTR